MNILVTGGAGYIGSHTVRALKKASYTPIIVDNLSRGHVESIPSLHLLVSDLQYPYYRTVCLQE